MVAVQGTNASPTVTAIETGADKVQDTGKAETIAGALRVSFGTEHALKAVRHSNGFGVALTDEEILSAQKEIARLDGIFTEVSSATALAGVSKSIKEGKMRKDRKGDCHSHGHWVQGLLPAFQGYFSRPARRVSRKNSSRARRKVWFLEASIY